MICALLCVNVLCDIHFFYRRHLVLQSLITVWADHYKNIRILVLFCQTFYHICLFFLLSFVLIYRSCVIAREITKLHEEFWRGTLGEANEAFATRQPKGEITVLIEGQLISVDETPSEDFLEHELRELMAKGHTLSAVHIQLNSLLHFEAFKHVVRI